MYYTCLLFAYQGVPSSLLTHCTTYQVQLEASVVRQTPTYLVALGASKDSPGAQELGSVRR